MVVYTRIHLVIVSIHTPTQGVTRAIDRKAGNMEKPVIIERAAIRRLNKYRR